jgi:hypothetical protein
VLNFTGSPIHPPSRCSQSTDKVSQVGSIMLLGETSELPLEPAIEGRFDRSRCVVPSGVAKKYVDTFLGCQSLNTNQRWCSLHRGEWSTGRGRMVRGLSTRLGFPA